MSVSIPLSSVAPQDYAKLKNMAIDTARRLAQQANPGKSIIVRDLSARDIAAGDDGVLTHTFDATLDTFENSDVADPTLDDDEVWVIFGIVLLSANPTMTQVRLGIGTATTIAEFELAESLATDQPGVIFQPFAVFKGAEIFNADFADAFTASTANDYAWLGVVAEPEGKVISSRPGITGPGVAF